MENVYLISPIGPEDKIAHVHAAVGTVNCGMSQNICDSILRVTKCIE
jgi:hypothetical protein